MKTTLASLLLLFGLHAHAQCIPPNNLYIHETANLSSMSKASFKDAIKKVLDAYKGHVATTEGAILQINDLWSDGTVNAQAYQKWVNGQLYYMIDAFGGLARHPKMTKNAFIAVLCHELGHHIGGAPKYRADWASNEGQSDYFATLRCMKKLGISSSAPALALSRTLADLGGERSPKRSSRDSSKVAQTYDRHPRAQCRLDIMDAGRACDATGKLSPLDPKPGTCFNYDGADNTVGEGNRPRCFFRP
ncbi:hypothetical protein UFOVP558_32 [uncultured Caudovirales phage]|uniref:Metalloprotease n=1 Tax=uncultured Caudovirales phage TaxID=2100421 RepID=A0A6J5N1F9_9CAUD|nr:hypothetical protein UFOVP558_32 [uncultured Caudovirales phage]